MLDEKNQVGTVLMDLSKAFDSLPHELLLAKLIAYGFNQRSALLIRNYLSNRKQRTNVGSKLSVWLDVVIEVPQRRGRFCARMPYCKILIHLSL